MTEKPYHPALAKFHATARMNHDGPTWYGCVRRPSRVAIRVCDHKHKTREGAEQCGSYALFCQPGSLLWEEIDAMAARGAFR